MKSLKFIPFFFIIYLTSCSNDDSVSQDIQIESNYEEILPGIIDVLDVDTSNYDNPHSELWIDENSNARTPNKTYTVKGITKATKTKTGKGMLHYSFIEKEPRVKGWTNTVFLSYYYTYEHHITVPKGASVVLPPAQYMESMPIMGYEGTSSKKGYSLKRLSSNSQGDTYALVTRDIEYEHDINGRLIFVPPVYNSQSFNRQNVEFKYQYVFSNWD